MKIIFTETLVGVNELLSLEATINPESIEDTIILQFIKSKPTMLKLKFPEPVLSKGAWYYK